VAVVAVAELEVERPAVVAERLGDGVRLDAVGQRQHAGADVTEERVDFVAAHVVDGHRSNCAPWLGYNLSSRPMGAALDS
jgi:hypothetical protein